MRIGLVDHHQVTRKGIISILESAGLSLASVLEASNGQELLDQMQELEIIPDLVILDISLPNTDGYTTIDALLKRHPAMRILVFSLYVAEDAIINAIARGASGYISKSADVDMLIEAVKAVSTYGFYLSPLLKQFRSQATARSIKGFHGKQVLSAKEIKFIKLATGNLTYKEIAEKMDVHYKTLENYRDSVFRKLNVNNRAALALYAIRTGIVSIF